MTDKVCDCQFCADYKYLNEMLPSIPEEHRAWVKGMCEAFWQADEELGYKKAILDGSWPNSVELLEHHLALAKQRLAAANAPVEPEAPEPQYVHTCDVVDISDGPCGDPSHDDPPVLHNYDGEVEDCEEDPWHCGSEHMGDFS